MPFEETIKCLLRPVGPETALASRLRDFFGAEPAVAIARCGGATVLQFTFLTKDNDFVNLRLTLGSPPKVILLLMGNCSTSQIEDMIRSNAVRYSAFERDTKRGLLILR